jgi:hypothetical protein
MQTQTQKVPLLLRLFLGAMLLPDVVLLPWLINHYEKSCPTQPSEEKGITYPLNEHGSVVYLTLVQHRRVLALEIYLVGSVFCFVAVFIWKYGLRPKRESFSRD